MRNLWIQTEFAFARWVANLDAQRCDPGSLLAFAVAVVRAGVEHRVFDVTWAPLIDYDKQRDGALDERLEATYRDRGVVDLFGFTGAAMAPGIDGSSTSEASLAWYDAGDRLVEGQCSDLGALLASLEPTPGSIPNGCMTHYPPVRVIGHRLEYPAGATAPSNLRERQALTVRFEIHSDIWFPWIFGSAHPECDHRRMFDNRELACIHTPRLNAFLRVVAAETRARGGRFTVDPYDTSTKAIQWLDRDGAGEIRLDLPAPEVMPASALDAEWF